MIDFPERLLTPNLLLRPVDDERDQLPDGASKLQPLRVIEVRSNGRTAGFVGQSGRHLSIELGAAHRGRGRGSEALSAWLDAALADSEPVTLEAQNETARAFLRKFGFDQGDDAWQSTERTRARLKDMLEAQDRRYRQRVHMALLELGIPGDFGAQTGLPLMYEARQLRSIGPDVFDRPQYLRPDAAGAWREMRAAASDEGVRFEAVSAFRGFDYQVGLIRRKMADGQSIDRILCVSAAPGYSEHHTGLAIDVTSGEVEPLTEAFEETDAFEWLGARAGDFGFVMSYPRDNPFGLAHEPWHWRYEPDASTRS